MTTLLRFARRYMVPYWHWYLGGTLALGATNWMSVTIPLYLAAGIDALALGEAGRPILLRSAIAVAVMGLLVIAIRTASRLLFFTPGRLVEAQVKHDLFERMMHQQPAFLDQWPTGDLISRAASDVTMARLLAGFASLGIVNTFVALVLTGTQMWRLSPFLAAMAVGPLLVGMVTTVAAAGRLRVLMKRLQEEAADLSDHILSSYQGVSAIHAFQAEPAFQRQFAALSNKWLRTVIDRANLRVAIGPVLSLAASFNVFLLLYVGGPMAIRGEISVGELVAFTTLTAYLTGPLRGMSFIVTLFRQAQAAMDRIDAILLPPIDRPEGDRPEDAPATPPALSIQDLSFAYPDDPDHLVLDCVSVEIPASGTLGVLGPTGSGKSTLLRCIARLYNPPAGTVTVDGTDLLDVDLDRWRHSMQLVQQRAFLFSEPVRDNILLGQGSDDRLWEVLELSALRPDLEALPDGVDTMVGESGLTLSGGQRQRVALARGLMHAKGLLLLDDVLSAVDHATEQQLISALQAAQPRPTTVIVSNRCSCLQHADVILVLDQGRVADRGTHEELIARDGLYRQVWEKQREGEEELTP